MRAHPLFGFWNVRDVPAFRDCVMAASVRHAIERDDDHVIGRIELSCDAVEQAKEWAKALFVTKPVELWEGSMRIARFDPTP
jgi:hypothetical protein